MGLFKDVMHYDESIFRNEEALQFDFLPPVLPHRENEVEHIAHCIKPLFVNRSPTNLLVSGASGVGKTVSVRFVFNELESTSEKVKPIYINCWENTTTHSVLVEMGKQVGLPFPSKGVSTDVIARSIFTRMKSAGPFVLCFDEIDKAEAHDFLYTASEVLGNRVCIILITNEPHFMARVDPRIRSRLCLEPLDFRAYTMDEMAEILAERAKHAFVPGAVSNEIINGAAGKAFELSDLRVGIFLLWKSGQIAESDASRTVNKEHLRNAMEKVIDFDRSRKLDSLDETGKVILNLIRSMKNGITGNLYKEYKRQGGKLTERSFRTYIKRLEQMGLIRTKETGKGFRGRSRVIEYGD